MRVEEFWSKVGISVAPDACWPWLAGCTGDGYGACYLNGGTSTRQTPAHRVAYALSREEFLPEHLQVCHTCDNPPCCNPMHLFLGTAKDNALDKVLKGRAATGDKNGARVHPEKRPRGEQHGRHTQPWASARGERIGTAKLTANQVLEIRARRLSIAAAARHYGVSTTHIKRIRRGVCWSHLGFGSVADLSASM